METGTSNIHPLSLCIVIGLKESQMAGLSEDPWEEDQAVQAKKIKMLGEESRMGLTIAGGMR